MSEKSRELWIHDFISNLQIEFLSYYARSILYERKIERDIMADICRKKKEKIDRMSYRNGKKSIFDDPVIWDKYVNLFIGNGYGLADFQYKSEEHKKKASYWDKFYYFRVGVMVEYGGKKFEIIRNYIKTEEVIINCNGKLSKIPYYSLKRDITDLLPPYHEKID